MGSRLWSVWAFAAWAGCSAQANICPAGLEPSPEGSCVAVFAQDAGGASESDAADAGEEPADAYATGDGSAEDAAVDATHDAPSETGPAPVPAPHCAASDVSSWDAFHSSEGLNDDLIGCAASCADQTCLVACGAESAGAEGCLDCMTLESTCLFQTCWMACGHWESSPDCRACLCEAGCTEVFEACAGHPMQTCDAAFDRDASPGEETPGEPLLLRYKPHDGAYAVDALRELEEETASLVDTYDTHWSTGWTHLSSFEREGQTYLVQHRSECGPAPCTFRISPLLADGRPGTPLLDEVWSRGWDELEVFVHRGEAYLLSLKTGAQAADDPGPAHVRVQRLDFGDEGTLALTNVFEARWPVGAGYTFTALETFAIDGQAYLLRYATEPWGDVDILRVAVDDEAGMQLEATGEATRWDQGFDVVRTFRTEEGWFVLRYKSGSLGGGGVENGTVEILPLVPSDAGPRFGPVAYTGDWGLGIGQVHGFRAGEASFLLTSKPVTPSRLRLYRLAPSSTWSSALGVLVRDQSQSGTRPWAVATVAHDLKWIDP